MVLSPKMKVSYSAMLLVVLKLRCTMNLNCSPSRVRSSTPTLPPCLRDELSKKSPVWPSED
jgi:hypothetical protein